MFSMNPDYRTKLLAILAKLDQIQRDADNILANPIDAENGAMAEELRELIVEMQAKVEEKLERGAQA
jgi:hypothetical protein